MKDPIRSLRKFAKRMHKKYPYMNHGGCCVFASMVSKHLRKVLPTTVAVGGYGYEPPIDKARAKVVRNSPGAWNAAGIYFCHVVTEIEHDGKKYFFDTKGVRKARDVVSAGGSWPLIEGRLTPEEAAELASYRSGWNHTFDRTDIPSIQRDVDKYFQKFLRRLSSSMEQPAV